MTPAGDPDAIDPKLKAALDDDLIAALLTWQRDVGAHVFYERSLDGGYTSARVFSVVIDKLDGGVRKGVLKAVPAGERGRYEADAHEAD